MLWVVIAAIVIGLVLAAGLAVVQNNELQSITPLKDFPVVSIDGTPTIDPATYVLVVDGTVQHRLALNLTELKALPSVTETEALRCVSGPTGRAEWTGVMLRTVLDMAGLNGSSMKVVFYSADGFTTDLNITESRLANVLICYQMDGVPLPPDQGFPVRIVVPDYWGYKWAKWVTHIEVVDFDYKGFWESRGWSDNALIAPPTDWYYHSILMTAAGVAGGVSGVSGVMNARWKKAGKPYFLNPRLHTYAGYAFVIFVVLVFVWWTNQIFFFRGSIFFTFLGRLGLGAVLLGVAGTFAGMSLNKDNERARWWHSAFTISGYALFVMAMVAGILLAF